MRLIFSVLTEGLEDSALHHQSKHQVREYFERMLFIVKIFQDPCGEVMLHLATWQAVIQPAI